MKFKIINESKDNLLDEATFSGQAHLERHYNDHVLKPDEEFNRDDPKFPNMTIQEYADAAEELSLAKAQPMTKEDIKYARGIIGWLALKDDPIKPWKGPREVKINLDSPKHPGFMEIVAYVDNAKDGNQIFSYMLARRGKKYREIEYKIGELPENETEQELTDDNMHTDVKADSSMNQDVITSKMSEFVTKTNSNSQKYTRSTLIGN